MNPERQTFAIPRRAAALIALVVSTSVAWCPEAPLLEKLQQAVLTPYLAMSPQEMSSHLARHDVRRLPAGFPALARTVDEESRRHGLPAELVLAVIWAESGFRTDAVSDRGAVGLMQLMPATAREIAAASGMAWPGDDALLDPRVNVRLGCHYLSRLLRAYDGDLDRTLAAYNRGPWSPHPLDVANGDGETSSFVRRVRALMARDDDGAAPRAFGDALPFRISATLTL